jgi:hypothetical protein
LISWISTACEAWAINSLTRLQVVSTQDAVIDEDADKARGKQEGLAYKDGPTSTAEDGDYLLESRFNTPPLHPQGLSYEGC